MPTDSRPSLLRASFVLLVLAVLSFAPDFRSSVIPSHDARQIHTALHFLTAGLQQDGAIPQWLPYGRFGNLAFQATLNLSPTAYLMGMIGAWLSVSCSIPLFKAMVLVEFLILVAGTLHLASMLYRSRFAFAMVGIGVILSFSWLSTIDATLHTFYLLPFILGCLIRFSREGRLTHGLAAALFCVLSAIGNVPYYPPKTALVLTVFCAVLLWKRPLRLERPWFRPVDAVLLGLIVLFAAAHVVTFAAGFSDLQSYTIGRDPTTQRVAFWSYLNASGVSTPATLLTAFLTGMHTQGDTTFYTGLAPLVLAVVALRRSRSPEARALAAAAIFLVLFSFGGLTARAAYFFPGMSYYRHIGLVLGEAKYLILLLAGFGMDRLLGIPEHPAEGPERPRAAALLKAGALLLFVIDSMLGVFSPAGTWTFLVWPRTVDPTLPAVLVALARLAIYGAVLGGTLRACRGRDPAQRLPALAAALLVAFTVDLGSFRILQDVNWRKLDAAEQDLSRETFALRPLPWQALRSSEEAEQERNPRLRFAAKQGVVPFAYVHTYTLVGFDPRMPGLRTDSLQRPVGDLLRARKHEFYMYPKDLMFPGYDRWFADAVGAGKPKLRVVGETEIDFRPKGEAFQTVAGLPLVADRVVIEGPPRPPAATPASGSVSDVRLRFDSLEATAVVEGSGPAWLYYADADHAGWRATVNGEAVDVSRANLAFKAVPLRPGTNRVVFRFDNGWATVAQSFLALASFPALAALAAARMLTGKAA